MHSDNLNCKKFTQAYSKNCKNYRNKYSVNHYHANNIDLNKIKLNHFSCNEHNSLFSERISFEHNTYSIKN